jgi:hypothetical protein
MSKTVLVTLLVLLLCGASSVHADDAPVMRIIMAQADDAGAYIDDVLETGRGHLARLDSVGKLRVWRAKFAGSNAGTVIVAIEYPSLVAYAEDDRKMSADAAYMSWARGLDRVRRIVSDSLYTEAQR